MTGQSQAFAIKQATRHKLDTIPYISTDRELLRQLQMSDAEAATFLGRTRQALHLQLGPTKGDGRAGYLKASDMLTLVSAARQLGKEFNPRSVLDYARRMRADLEPEAFALLEGLLGDEPADIDFAGAAAMILVLPSFAEMAARFRGLEDSLKKMVADARARNLLVAVIGPTSSRARMAGSQLGVDDKLCFGDELADLYLPTIVILGDRESGVFVLTENEKFVGAPQFNRASMAHNIQAMLPPEVRAQVQSR